MSLIVARSTSRCLPGGTTATAVCDYFPAVARQVDVGVGLTVVVDSILIARYRAVKWLVVLANADLTRVKSFEVYSTHRNGTTPIHNEYAVLGDISIRFNATVSIAAGELQLNIQNTDTELLTAYVTRMPVPITKAVFPATSVVELVKINTMIRAGQTGVLDFIPITDVGMLAAHWSVAITDANMNRQASQIFGRLTSIAEGTEYGTIGDMTLDYTLALTEVVGQGLEISLQNTSGVDYVVDATRIPVHTVADLEACGKNVGDFQFWMPAPVTIDSGATKLVDMMNSSTLEAAKWLLAAMETTSNRTMGCELAATNPSAATAQYVQYGIIADYLDLDIATTEIAGRLALEITNNELNPVTVNLLRVPTAS